MLEFLVGWKSISFFISKIDIESITLLSTTSVTRGEGGKSSYSSIHSFFLYKNDLLIPLRIKKMLISKRVLVFSRMPY